MTMTNTPTPLEIPAAPSQTQRHAWPENPGEVFSIVGIVLAFLQLSLIGIIFSIIAFNKSRAVGAPTGHAVTGIVLNAISIVGALLIIMFYVALFSWAVSLGGAGTSPSY